MAKANVVEHAKKPDYKGKKHVDFSSKVRATGTAAKKYKYLGNCYICNKSGHGLF